MRKGYLIRYSIEKYHDVGNDSLFPREVDHRLMRMSTARQELRRLQDQDFANGALYGLSRWSIPADSVPDLRARHYTIED